VNALQAFTILVPARENEPSIDPGVLTLLAGACRDHVRLRFSYSDRQGAPSRREAEPYRLVNWGRRWYLVAWDVEREAWRTFRVDRIEPRLPLGARFSPRALPEEDVAAYVARGVTGSSWGFRARVIVHAPAAQVSERIGRWVGTVEAIDERSCVLDAGASSPEMMALYLGLLDADFTVTDPPELVDHLCRLAERYQGSTAA
jgi:predicted DNA-binding transcriptional regulator YafY